jgi:hypothetical protein
MRILMSKKNHNTRKLDSFMQLKISTKLEYQNIRLIYADKDVSKIKIMGNFYSIIININKTRIP